MQHEATTAELAEVFSVTRKTIAEWAKSGVMVKTSHGKYNLRESLRNWAEYQRTIADGGDLDLWMIRRDQREWEEQERAKYKDIRPEDLVPLDLTLQTFWVTLDSDGRVIGAVPADDEDSSRAPGPE